MANNKINLITGGSGFIGANLIERLINKGNKVICMDNFSTGKLHNVSKWINHENFKLINHDIVKPIDLDYEISYIWHLACPASPQAYQKNPIKTLETCFCGTLRMLKLSKKLNAKFLFASSSEVYGSQNKIQLKETNSEFLNSFGVRSCYSEGKRIAEILCLEYIKKYSLDIKIARIFNTYGPRMEINDGRVVSSFFKQALNNENFKIFGDGSQTRSFCYIDDLIDILIKIMYGKYKNLGPINVGRNEEISILELAKLIQRNFNIKNSIIFSSLREDDPIKRKPDLSKVQKYYNWHAKTSLNNGLQKTFDFYKNNL